MILHNIQPEQQLCLILARKSLSPRLAARARSLMRNGVDWDKVWGFSARHRVFPLVFRHLERFTDGLVPRGVLRLFQVLCEANSRKSDALAVALARIIEFLGRADISAVPFKGPLLAKLVWGDHRLWVGQDLDILVRREHLRRAEELFCANGYRPVFALDKPGKRDPVLLGRGKPGAVLLAKQDESTTTFVDLHESLLPWPTRRKNLEEQIWNAVQPGDVFGASGLLLPPVWNFILLSLHATKHFFLLLRWVCELYELWNSTEIDQNTVLRMSEQFGLNRDTLLSVAVCERVLGESSTLCLSGNDALVTRLSRNVLRRPLSPISTAIQQLRLPGSASDRLNRLATTLLAPTPIERDLLPLPRCLHFLYYGIRPIRLLLKHGLEQPIARTRTP